MVLPLGDLQRTQITPIVTYVLIALNVVMYLVQLGRGDEFTTALAATPFEIARNIDLAGPIPDRITEKGAQAILEARALAARQAPAPIPVRLTLLSSLFLHGSLIHLVGNMLFLWIFGDNVEEVLGPFRYLIAYLGFGLVGTLAQVAASPDSLVPTLGASGAIAGVMGAYVVWFPYNRVRVLVVRIVVEVPAIVVIGGWMAFQVWRGAGARAPGQGRQRGVSRPRGRGRGGDRHGPRVPPRRPGPEARPDVFRPGRAVRTGRPDLVTSPTEGGSSGPSRPGPGGTGPRASLRSRRAGPSSARRSRRSTW